MISPSKTIQFVHCHLYHAVDASTLVILALCGHLCSLLLGRLTSCKIQTRQTIGARRLLTERPTLRKLEVKELERSN
jgi:hypothetical protein